MSHSLEAFVYRTFLIVNPQKSEVVCLLQSRGKERKGSRVTGHGNRKGGYSSTCTANKTSHFDPPNDYNGHNGA
eukprot:787934-Pelagomonas_calceolata.AAC.2